MDEKLKKIILVVMACFAILFLFLFLMSSCEKKYTPQTLEIKIVESAKNYYYSHKEELPNNNMAISLSLSDLSAKGIIKDVNKLLEKGTSCSGTLTIENNNNYYMYSPNLNCTSPTETYVTNNLKELLLDKVVTSGNGLYNINGKYYFRGENVDNYLIFDGILWRILGINNDKSIRLIEAGRRDPVIWDDNYNEDTKSSTGINNFYSNGLNSKILENLNNIYKDNTILSENGKGYLKETSLCIGKRSITEIINDGSIECSTTIDNQYIGLLQLNEYLIASLDQNCIQTDSNSCRNYNYLAKFVNSYWTLTANTDNTHQVYKINSTIMSTAASNTGMARMVINISENTNVTGEGTEKNPYIISGFTNELKQ